VGKQKLLFFVCIAETTKEERKKPLNDYGNILRLVTT